MAIKHIKLFEEYSEEYDTERDLLESIYEDWKIEQDDLEDLSDVDEYEDVYEDEDEMEDWNDDDAELTSGEKAALARDFQILSKPQMAALFLRALGKMEDDPGKYLIMINGLPAFGEKDKDSMAFHLTIPALAGAIGLDSVRTVSRTVRKFYNLLTGAGETSGEAIYPKILKAFQEFNQRTPREVAMLASEAIMDPMESTKHRDAAAAAGPRSAADRLRRKQEQLKLGGKVHSLIQSLKRVDAFREPGQAERMAVNKLANEIGIDPSRISLAYSKFLSDRGIK